MSGPPPPPPPPPPPMPGFGGPPPPPPPPPGGNTPVRPGKKDVPQVSALLGDISKGTRLKPAVTNDRSAPMVKKEPGTGGPVASGAPPIPGAPRPPAGLAPPPGRARANSDSGGGSTNDSGLGGAPQLGGLFAGGMPKLKKTGKNLDAEPREAMNSHSDSESPKRMTNLRPPPNSAPRPPPAPMAVVASKFCPIDCKSEETATKTRTTSFVLRLFVGKTTSRTTNITEVEFHTFSKLIASRCSSTPTSAGIIYQPCAPICASATARLCSIQSRDSTSKVKCSTAAPAPATSSIIATSDFFKWPVWIAPGFASSCPGFWWESVTFTTSPTTISSGSATTTC